MRGPPATEQAPRPELKGDTVLTHSQPGANGASPPPQTLAEMKADWDNARDEGIGSLSPSELGPAYAFVSDWNSWWKEHQDKELSQLKVWSRDQVRRRWTLNMASNPNPPAPPLNKPCETTKPLAEIEVLKRCYEQAWVLFEGAKGNPARRLVAIKALNDMKSRHPYLSPHIAHLLQQLA